MDCMWRERNYNSHITLQVDQLKRNILHHMNNCTFTRSSVPPVEKEGWVHTYICTMHFPMFGSFQRFRLVLEADNRTNTSYTCIVENFKPFWNIRPKAPQQLSVTVNSTTLKVNITWQNNAVIYLKNNLQHELEYWSKKTKEDAKVKSKANDIRHLVIEEVELEPDTNYIARVRSKPTENGRYQGSWSMWSSEIKWKTTEIQRPADNPSVGSTSRLLFAVMIPLSLAVIIFISLYFRIPARVVNKVWIHVPNPATFFQPLYREHNGNFKEWIYNEQPTTQHNPGGSSIQELREMNRLMEADVKIINPRVDAVSNISYLKPIPINHTSTLTPDSIKHNFDLDAMYVKSNCLTEPSKSFYSTSVWEYCGSISGLGETLPVVPAEGQHRAESWSLFEDVANTTLSSVPDNPDSGYSYSDEYCTLSHSETSHGLVPAKIGLRLKVANGCQPEKREVAVDLDGFDGSNLPSACPAATEKEQLPQ
ncbi:interleukin-9 receptor-like isoform X2 [Heterodontus francisci]